MSSRAFDLALAGSKGVKVLPDLTTLPSVGDVVAAGSIVNNDVFLKFNPPGAGASGPIYNPRDFGAKGDGVTDDSAAFQAMFTQMANAGGGSAYLQSSFYIASAITVPDGVEIYGNASPTSMQYNWSQSYFQAPGSKLILGAGMTLGRACTLRNIMVIANNLPRSNPTTPTQANALLAQMAANGTGITLAKDNCLIDSVQVLGFNYGIRAVSNPACNRHMLFNVHGDNINGIWLDTGGDACRIIGAHMWPYLTVASGTPANDNRSGYGIYTKNNGGTIQVSHCVCYGYRISYMADSNTATFSQCWADGPGTVANTVGYATTGSCGLVQLINCQSVIQQFAVHHAPSNGAVMAIIGCLLTSAGPGGNTPSTGMTVAVLADGYGPVQCEGTYFSWGPNVAFWLGANSGPSIIIGNTFDDNNAMWDHIWNVDPSVLPLLTKHSNRVINSTRNFTEQVIGTAAMSGVAVYDQMPQGLNSTPVGAVTPSIGSFTNLAVSGAVSGAGLNNLFLSPPAAIGGAASVNGFFNNLQVRPNYNLFLTQTGNGTDKNNWGFSSQGGGTGALSALAWNDAFTAFTEWLHITRTGYVPQQITLTAPTISLSGAVTLSADPAAAMQPVTLQYYNAHLPAVPAPSGTLPLMDGSAAVGASALYSRQDHVHPTDTSRAPLASPTFTGTVTLPAANANSIDTSTGNITLHGGSALYFQQTGMGADQNVWDIQASGNAALEGYAWNDAHTTFNLWLQVTRSGAVPQQITLTAPTIVHAGATVISASGGPTIRAGAGAATGTQPKGSIWLRTDGAVGSTLYVTQGGGTWAAVAGV